MGNNVIIQTMECGGKKWINKERKTGATDEWENEGDLYIENTEG